MSRSRQRLLGVAWLGLVLLWLPIEDTNIAAPLALGVLGAAWLYVRFVVSEQNASKKWKTWAQGTLIGGTAIPLAALLMIFKSGVHDHGFPDFPLSDFVDLLSLLPIGLALGFVASLLTLRRWKQRTEKAAPDS